MDAHNSELIALGERMQGELKFDSISKTIYATDASAYREMPLAVAFPENKEDLKLLIDFAQQQQVGLIPRTAGTSLAGQVVGSGIVVDVSRTFTQILNYDEQTEIVTVQPGVIRDELNHYLSQYKRLFGPETSTANRAMIGGMVGNNSCGSNSVMYGSTRDHLVAVKALLADGNEVMFEALSEKEFKDKLEGKTTVSPLEQQIYQNAHTLLEVDSNRQLITDRFPKAEIPRRNHGYALDLLMDTKVFELNSEKPFNFCKLIAGSEGTLCFITEIQLKTVPFPPPVEGLLCVHFDDLYDSLEATVASLQFKPGGVELMDKIILDCTKESREHKANRFFIEGDPAALLVIQLFDETQEKVTERANRLIEALKAQGLGYHFPLLFGEDCKKVWNLRKAGLGLLSNIPGDKKPAPVIEDTAVAVPELPAYIKEFNGTLKKYNLSCVHYAHAGSGELHLRPILNLKTKEGNELFRTILQEIATLVKKYRGSLSGEHGDGRLRGEFIPFMVGEEVFEMFRDVKNAWDPNGIFNPNKIIDTPPMNTSLRYTPGQETPAFSTIFRYDHFDGYLRSVELCNGSGDCRKTELTGGTMCPTYMATRDEAFTTRARANMIRESLTHIQEGKPFNHPETHEVLSHCISCKGCKQECPSSVDMARLKTEYEHHYQENNGISFRTKMVGNFTKASAMFAPISGVYNAVGANPITGKIIRKVMKFAPERSLPELHRVTLNKWFSRQPKVTPSQNKVVYFFNDEFTNFNDVTIGQQAILLLRKLGYDVRVIKHEESGRTYFSKGLLKAAKQCANANVKTFAEAMNHDAVLVGVEPSAILSFRDEYPDIVDLSLKEKADHLSEKAFTIEEFLAAEMDKGVLKPELFHAEEREILIHGHCHQKALSSVAHTRKILSLPTNYTARLIPSGCCGMAGSFGYEVEHYDLSMKIGELVLFPAVRKASDSTIIAAAGTSCRHQIWDGTKRKALHPVEVLFDAMV
tara:strand:- start:15583 stop:18522 length:2940 start_codon:yes stop_codon:yes gene_type:complete